LQNDKQVQKISKHITKKVADKLTSLFNNDRERYENCWKDIATFIKFGCIKDEDFYNKVQKILIFKDLNGKYNAIESYFGEEVSEEDAQKGVQPKPIYYVSDEVQQAQYVAMFKDAEMNAVLCDTYIDPHFISYIEYKNPKKCRFVRIDADIDGALKSDADTQNADNEAIIELFKKHLVNKDIQIKTERLKSGKIPAVVTVEEFMRRMREMSSFYGMDETDSMRNATLVLNVTNPVINGIINQSEDKQSVIVNQVYYLAMLSYKKLSSTELADFVDKSSALLFDYCKQ
jgi:molecular chaperone HtpG